MTMRLSLSRNVETAKDDWGGDLPADHRPYSTTIPCLAWPEQTSSTGDEENVRQHVTVDIVRVKIPVGTDITVDDQVANITDRSQPVPRVIYAGPYRIDGPIRREFTHWELALRKVG